MGSLLTRGKRIGYTYCEKGGKERKATFSLLTFFFRRKYKLVFLTARVHPFPFRTRKLSSSVPKILDW